MIILVYYSGDLTIKISKKIKIKKNLPEELALELELSTEKN